VKLETLPTHRAHHHGEIGPSTGQGKPTENFRYTPDRLGAFRCVATAKGETVTDKQDTDLGPGGRWGKDCEGN
jgi:hypothetical protein